MRRLLLSTINLLCGLHYWGVVSINSYNLNIEATITRTQQNSDYYSSNSYAQQNDIQWGNSASLNLFIFAIYGYMGYNHILLYTLTLRLFYHLNNLSRLNLTLNALHALNNGNKVCREVIAT